MATSFKEDTFSCPKCNFEDVVWDRMPRRCYNCKTPYVFDLSKLLTNEEERKLYYNYGKTTMSKKAELYD